MAESELERLAAQPLPSADELAGRFARQPHPSPASDAQLQKVMSDLHFGVDFSDHMARAVWRAGEGWSEREVVPYGPISLQPAAAVLHYGQEVFEGIKAYKREDGSIWTFRPGFNAARFNASAHRLAMPPMDEGDFVASLVDLVRADARWVPSVPGASLYLRPFMFASEAFVGVHPAKEITYLAIASPSGPYFAHGFAPVSIYVTEKYHRAGPGGTGAAKTGGNYASSLLPQEIAYEKGYEQVCFLDAATNTNIDELGGMNLFVVDADGSLRTPTLTGNILEGGTRGAIMRLMKDSGRTVTETTISLRGLIDDIRAGKVTEVFACGTAAVVTPVGKLGGTDFEVEIPAGPVTQEIYQKLTDIQWGRAEDPYGWCYRLV